MRKVLLAFILVIFGIAAHSQKIWTTSRAKEWYARQPWLIGCNFIPSTAINELEMWQADTWDPKTIDRELSWAEGLGFNVVRVYLHNLVWEEDADGFKNRINEFLTIADSHRIKALFVLFDDCWNKDPKIGKQPEPRPGVHNSGWMQAPGQAVVKDQSKWGSLEKYTKELLTAFKNDKRIIMWDLYNEPGNEAMFDKSLPFLKKVFEWAWSVRPSQPLTCATWNHDKAYNNLNEFQLASSDIITFHNYNDPKNLEEEILKLQKLGRPLVCSEYMARTNDSRFETNLPVFKKYRVGAINWGLVSGKTNTIFPWGSKEGSPEPKMWFHDVFRSDGTAFSDDEVKFIKGISKQ
jgi:hypothetical protein